MTGLSWNCHGLGNPRTVQVLRDFILSKRPKFVFLMETLVDKGKVEVIKEMIKYEGCYVVDNVGHSGGLAMLWEEQQWATVLGSSRNHIDLKVTVEGMGIWRLTGYYGHPERCRRHEAWELLQSLATISTLPWCCIGDYNDLLTQAEKRGRRSHPEWLIKGFREATEASGLIDIGMEGFQFTWEKSRGTPDWIEERLDRAMVTQTWLSRFPNSIVYGMEASESDHIPLFLDTRYIGKTYRQRRFRFETIG